MKFAVITIVAILLLPLSVVAVVLYYGRKKHAPTVPVTTNAIYAPGAPSTAPVIVPSQQGNAAQPSVLTGTAADIAKGAATVATVAGIGSKVASIFSSLTSAAPASAATGATAASDVAATAAGAAEAGTAEAGTTATVGTAGGVAVAAVGAVIVAAVFTNSFIGMMHSLFGDNTPPEPQRRAAINSYMQRLYSSGFTQGAGLTPPPLLTNADDNAQLQLVDAWNSRARDVFDSRVAAKYDTGSLAARSVYSELFTGQTVPSGTAGGGGDRGTQREF